MPRNYYSKSSETKRKTYKPAIKVEGEQKVVLQIHRIMAGKYEVKSQRNRIFEDVDWIELVQDHPRQWSIAYSDVNCCIA
jgi:hypothetical protein